MYRLDVPQLYAAQCAHDVIVISLSVHFDSRGSQILFVGGQPDFGPLAHKGVVTHRKPGLIIGPQRLFSGGQLGQRATINDLLPPV